MIVFLLFLHSLFRWLVLISLVYAIYRAWIGYHQQRVFTPADNSIRHWTATIAHIQLLIGMLLYTQSPIIKYFWHNYDVAIHQPEISFFGLVHLSLMVTAIVTLTIGSSLSKRRLTDQEKFFTMLIWFTIALVIIFIAIPWPFSPLANRTWFRTL
jgi:hypothetical protein